MSIEFDDRIPIYVQIMDLIKRDMVTGRLKGGDKLPSVREMAESLKVNPNTVARAYQEMERERIVFTQRGMGTFTTKNEGMISIMKKEMAKDVVDTYVNDMKNMGFHPKDMIEILKSRLEEKEA